MIIKQIIINNFRNIKKMNICFDNANVLLVGNNNVGKSNILNALNLALGPDSLNSPDAINENDFYGRKYLDEEGNPIKIMIEVRLINLTKKQKSLFRNHLEYWDKKEDKYVGITENLDENRYSLDCLRIGFDGYYDVDEDEFSAYTYYLNPEFDESEIDRKERFSRKDKREIGFLYLRELRTGSRALSFERGSLLDIIMKLKNIKKTSWEGILKKLEDISTEIDETVGFREVLDSIENKTKEYIAPTKDKKNTAKIEITDLTRNNLRNTLSIFIGTEPTSKLVPFKSSGTGTINVLLLTLMSFIADLKRDNEQNVIFAMEEPEIAIPPYTQRRVVNDLFKMSDQTIVTSHSPYIAERFIEYNLTILNNNGEELSGNNLDFCPIKEKNFRKDFRSKFAESILSRGIIAVEGISDELVLYTTSKKLSEFSKEYLCLDVLGLVVFNSEGAPNINNIGEFFKKYRIKTYTIYDKNQSINKEYFIVAKEHDYLGLEALLIKEIPVHIQEKFLKICADDNDYPYGIDNISDKETTDIVCEILKKRKREGYAAKLVNICEKKGELPKTFVSFLEDIKNDIIK